ncbi:MAG: hypothetical protein OXR64_05000 [Chloroflexota bacterium]|nr:hypothetical protein [Chloroflexota bacterium]MDE2919185.1 hypothetical protein [Chloroflexota bacterium]
MADPSRSAAALTRAELREELDRSLAHYATKADLAELRGELKSEIANLRADLIKWMIGLMLGSVTAAVGIAAAVDRLLG